MKTSKLPSKYSRSVGWMLCLFLLSIVAQACTQTGAGGSIRGRVLDLSTREPLPHTNVFLAHTTIGVITGIDGRYILKSIPPGNYQIVFNRVGYVTATREVSVAEDGETIVDIRIEQKTIDAGQVDVVAAIPRTWRSQLIRFKEAFIGETSNGQKCDIDNPEVLRFEIDPASSDLLAYSDSTLRLTNRSLGYRLYIILGSSD